MGDLIGFDKPKLFLPLSEEKAKPTTRASLAELYKSLMKGL